MGTRRSAERRLYSGEEKSGEILWRARQELKEEPNSQVVASPSSLTSWNSRRSLVEGSGLQGALRKR